VKWALLCSSLSILWHCPSLGLEWTLPFSSPVATAEFSKFAGIPSAALSQQHLSGLKNSSAGIPSPPRALLVVILPKAHLTSHARMSGSRWVTTPLWSSRSLRPFLYSSSVYSGHLFLISSASVRSMPFLSFIEPIFAWNVPLVSLSFLKRPLVFPLLLFSSISLHCSLKKALLSLLASFGTLHSDGYISPFLLCLSPLFFSQLFVRLPQTTILPFCISFAWGWFWSLPPVQCCKPLSIVLQALCLSDLVPWTYLSLPLYNHVVVQSLSRVWLCNPMDCTTPGFPVHHQLWSLLKHVHWLGDAIHYLILFCPLLLLPSIFPSIRVFSNESALHIRWPKYWSFSFSISLSSEYLGLISFRKDWLDLLAVQGTLKSLLQHLSSKASILRHSAFFIVQLSHPYMTTGKTKALARQTFVGKVMSLLFNMLSRMVITFRPRSKCLLISWLQSPSAVILEPPKLV